MLVPCHCQLHRQQSKDDSVVVGQNSLHAGFFLWVVSFQQWVHWCVSMCLFTMCSLMYTVVSKVSASEQGADGVMLSLYLDLHLLPLVLPARRTQWESVSAVAVSDCV